MGSATAALAIAAACLAGAVAAAAATPLGRKYSWSASTPPRLQWLGNDGYCGEVSAIMAGLKFGQYLSQYDLRDVATGSQLRYYLVGENDGVTARRLRLQHSEYPNTCVPREGARRGNCARQYLAWAKNQTRHGGAVTITVYMNYNLFYGSTDPRAGEVDYDHIVSVARVDSDYDDDAFHADDLLTIVDHGLWSPDNVPQYAFTYAFGAAMGSREEANSPDGEVYTVPDAYSGGNFGIAHTGPADGGGELVPVRVDTSVNFERPGIKDGSQVRPPPMPLNLTVTASALVPGVRYMLYEYANETAVPTAAFNAHKADAAASLPFVAAGGDMDGANATFTVRRSIMSDEKVFYRAVRADAP
uniref:Uncharacterized protein n=1 Tax=Bicosoecida sp. CB-2014 TaxID=1486930 RepID=A0A7S1G6T1_9STRA